MNEIDSYTALSSSSSQSFHHLDSIVVPLLWGGFAGGREEGAGTPNEHVVLTDDLVPSLGRENAAEDVAFLRGSLAF